MNNKNLIKAIIKLCNNKLKRYNIEINAVLKQGYEDSIGLVSFKLNSNCKLGNSNYYYYYYYYKSKIEKYSKQIIYLKENLSEINSFQSKYNWFINLKEIKRYKSIYDFISNDVDTKTLINYVSNLTYNIMVIIIHLLVRYNNKIDRIN